MVQRSSDRYGSSSKPEDHTAPRRGRAALYDARARPQTPGTSVSSTGQPKPYR